MDKKPSENRRINSAPIYVMGFPFSQTSPQLGYLHEFSITSNMINNIRDAINQNNLGQLSTLVNALGRSHQQMVNTLIRRWDIVPRGFQYNLQTQFIVSQPMSRNHPWVPANNIHVINSQSQSSQQQQVQQIQEVEQEQIPQPQEFQLSDVNQVVVQSQDVPLQIFQHHVEPQQQSQIQDQSNQVQVVSIHSQSVQVQPVQVQSQPQSSSHPPLTHAQVNQRLDATSFRVNNALGSIAYNAFLQSLNRPLPRNSVLRRMAQQLRPSQSQSSVQLDIQPLPRTRSRSRNARLTRVVQRERSVRLTAAQARAIGQLPYVRHQQVQQCIICYEDLETGQVIGDIPCQHKFHRHCIVSYFTSRATNHSCCPVCRFSLKNQTYQVMQPVARN